MEFVYLSELLLRVSPHSVCLYPSELLLGVSPTLRLIWCVHIFGKGMQ